MTVEERIDRLEGNLDRLVAVQDQMMDLLGLSLEGERRLATRMERMEENMERLAGNMQRLAGNMERVAGNMERLEGNMQRLEGNMERLETTVQEIGDKLNGLIGVVDDFIRRKQ